MLRHLQACKKRSAKLVEEKGKRRCRYFQVVITGKYQKDYWLIVEASENTTLKELDAFWGKLSRNMNYRLKDVVDVGDNFLYEYDFGSTTELVLSIHSCRDGEKKNNEIVILSRNNSPKILCSNCEQNEAKWVNPEGYYEGVPFWCDECLEAKNEEEGEYYEPEFLLPVCNFPRMGVCGYEGSDSYPDQFELEEQ